MSFFRDPGEPSSGSDDGGDPDHEEMHHDSHNMTNPLSPVRTMDSASTEPNEPIQNAQTVAPTESDPRRTNLLLHSYIEADCMRKAAEQLRKDTNDPAVQSLGQTMYHALCQQLSDTLGIDRSFEADNMSEQRAAVQEGIRIVSQRNINMIQSTQVAASEDNRIARPAIWSRVPSVISSLSSITSVPPSIQSIMTDNPVLHTERYRQEFIQIDTIGKGGFGKVYKVMNKLDKACYAVKQVIMDSARISRLQERGKDELNRILEEVRTLARLDHHNIVRYHNAWLEYSTGSVNLAMPLALPLNRMIESGPEGAVTDAISGSLENPFDNHSFSATDDNLPEHSNRGVIFEYSEIERDASSSNMSAPSMHRVRRPSQATVASSQSRKSAVESMGPDDDDDDVETIPRTQHTSNDSTSGIGTVSHSDLPMSPQSPGLHGPSLTLNIQMTLYPTTLAAFLSMEQPITQSNSSPDTEDRRHCFHPCISLQILQKILKGVQYLHSKDVLHRDLKPANVFLSISNDSFQPSGSVNLSSCRDFGLVTALAGNDQVAPGLVSDNKIGTEFYRAPTSSGLATEKLDVFALGIIAFELMRKFDTKMERYAELGNLRQGKFPKDFASSIGDGGEAIEQCIRDMVHGKEEERITCIEVKDRLSQLIPNM